MVAPVRLANASIRRRGAALAIDAAVVAIPVLAAAGRAARLAEGRHATAWLGIGAFAALLPVALAVIVAAFGSTPGKALLGLRVVGADGRRASRSRLLRRELGGRLLVHGLAIAAALALLGPYLARHGADDPPRVPVELLLAGQGLAIAAVAFLWATRDRAGQGWHDKVAGTRVVGGTAEPPVLELTPPFARPDRLADDGLVYPSWFERLGAWLIDVALVLTAIGTVMVAVGIAIGAVRSDDVRVPHHTAVLYGVLVGAALVAGTALYGGLAVGFREQTVGKHALGLVVRATDGSRAGFARAFRRELVGRLLVEQVAGALLLEAPVLVSGLWSAWDRRRQTWHDRIGGTIVVRGVGCSRPRRAPAPRELPT